MAGVNVNDYSVLYSMTCHLSATGNATFLPPKTVFATLNFINNNSILRKWLATFLPQNPVAGKWQVYMTYCQKKPKKWQGVLGCL